MNPQHALLIALGFGAFCFLAGYSRGWSARHARTARRISANTSDLTRGMKPPSLQERAAIGIELRTGLEKIGAR